MNMFSWLLARNLKSILMNSRIELLRFKVMAKQWRCSHKILIFWLSSFKKSRKQQGSRCLKDLINKKTTSIWVLSVSPLLSNLEVLRGLLSRVICLTHVALMKIVSQLSLNFKNQKQQKLYQRLLNQCLIRKLEEHNN